MAQQTINVGTAPNDGTGTPLRTAFQYTNSNFSELYTAVGPSGNNIVVPGNATITGDLTVDTSTLKVDSANNRVGIGTASPANQLSVRNEGASGIAVIDVRGGSAGAGAVQISGNATTLGTTSFDLLQNSSGAFVNQRDANPLSMFVNGSERYAISSSGIATWSNVGGVAGTAMTLNSTGLGIGLAPVGGVKLSVAGTIYANAGNALILDNPSSNFVAQIKNTGSSLQSTLAFLTGSGTSMLIDNSGNVGIGVTPSAWGGSYKALQLQSVARNIAATGAGLGDFTVAFNAIYDSTDSRWEYAGTGDKAGRYSQTGSGNHRWFVSNTAGTAGNEITDFASPAMTLDASGNLLVGKTASSTTVVGSQIQPDGTFSAVKGDANPGFFYNRSTAASGTIALFRSNSVTVGSITQDGTNTSYVTTSDYRLKEDVQPLVGGLARVSALKPSIYKWKSNGSTGEGFLAHELADVVPSAVIGSKDEVNEDGSIKAQGVDLSKVVPVLVAAIQELTARVQTLETR